MVGKYGGIAPAHKLIIRDTALRGLAMHVGITGAVSYAISYRDHTGKPRQYVLRAGDFAKNDDLGIAADLKPK